MENLVKAMLSVMTVEQKESLANGETSVEDAVRWFKSLNSETLKDIKSGKIKL